MKILNTDEEFLLRFEISNFEDHHQAELEGSGIKQKENLQYHLPQNKNTI